ncbi:MAG: hypothetical protein AAGJ83_06760 [Planctomycetota bacterium]
MRRSLKTLISVFVGAFLVVPVSLWILGVHRNPSQRLLDRIAQASPISLSFAAESESASTVLEGNWPPRLNERFPDLLLHDQHGHPTRLSEFSGKIILVEYAAIPCAGCQAFAGGKTLGSFEGFPVQNLESIDEYARRFAGTELGTDDVVFVQLLLYGRSMSAPSADEVAGWAEHFRMDRAENRIVLRGDVSLLSQATYDLIPGFHLIDRDFTLRSDSCGHQPRENLYRELLPKLGKLQRQSRVPSGPSIPER